MVIILSSVAGRNLDIGKGSGAALGPAPWIAVDHFDQPRQLLGFDLFHGCAEIFLDRQPSAPPDVPALPGRRFLITRRRLVGTITMQLPDLIVPSVHARASWAYFYYRHGGTVRPFGLLDDPFHCLRGA